MIQRFIIIAFLLLPHSALADRDADKAEFKKLYAEFNDLYTNSEDIDPIIAVGEKLYKLAPKAYGKNSQNMAVVTYNLATLYDEKGGETSSRDEIKAVRLYEQQFRILDKIKSPKDQNYVSQLISLINADYNANRTKSKKSHIKKAIKIMEDINLPNNSIAHYQLNFALLRYKANDQSQAEDLMQSSLERYQNEFGEDHFKVGENLFWLAKVYMAKRKRASAEEHFLKALAIFENKEGDSAPLAQSTHAFLVNLYEDMGQSDKATKHCQAIAEERPLDFDRFVDPLYRKNPTFPQLNSREMDLVQKKGADVLLEFDVDENGITRNVKVIESNNRKFNYNSIVAAQSYRYAPSVKDGKIIETKGVKVKIEYRLTK